MSQVTRMGSGVFVWAVASLALPVATSAQTDFDWAAVDAVFADFIDLPVPGCPSLLHALLRARASLPAPFH